MLGGILTYTYSSLPVFAIVLLPLFSFEGVMEGSSSSSYGSSRGGQGLPSIWPQPIVSEQGNETNVPTSNGGVPNIDPVARRRQANREYSHRYRVKQHVHVQQLQDREKFLLGHISTHSPKLKFFKDTGSQLSVENNSLKGEFSEARSILIAESDELEQLQSRVEQLKLLKEAQEAHIARRMNSRDK